MKRKYFLKIVYKCDGFPMASHREIVVGGLEDVLNTIKSFVDDGETQVFSARFEMVY